MSGKKNSLIVQGFETATGAGGPWKMAEGRADPGPGEIVLDEVTMKSNGLSLGGQIDIDGQTHQIVGVSQDTTLLVAQYAFVDITETRKVLGPDRVNFIMLQVDPAREEAVRQDIGSRHPELTVYTREEFAANNAAVISNGILPILAVIVAIAVIIGVIIVGLVVYSATIEKYREYGVLKAVGAGGLQLYKIVLEQSLISSLLGYGVGVVGSVGVAWLIRKVEVQISITFSPKYFLSAFMAAMVMSVLASYIPARKINRIDPVIVFKA
jgi:putative ABC transport system permease protein